MTPRAADGSKLSAHLALPADFTAPAVALLPLWTPKSQQPLRAGLDFPPDHMASFREGVDVQFIRCLCPLQAHQAATRPSHDPRISGRNWQRASVRRSTPGV